MQYLFISNKPMGRRIISFTEEELRIRDVKSFKILHSDDIKFMFFVSPHLSAKLYVLLMHFIFS